ncbi:MAG: hypothetical protein RIT27_246 [Pseudomonadota bacterium]|jgi:hypothetical protein
MIFNKFLILIIFMGFLSACGGGGSSGNVQEGITVSFYAAPHSTLQTIPAGNKTFRTTEGVQITLKKAFLVIWSVKLESDCRSSNFVKWFDWLIPQAVAHAPETPTQLGVPNVINILAEEGNSLKLGDIYPAPATYCGVTTELMKADEDTQHLPTEINMLNRVLYLEGEYVPLGRNEAIPFVIDLSKTPRPQQIRLSVPLILSEVKRTAQINLQIHYDRWFDGVDFNALSEENQKDFLLNNITRSIQ